MIEPTPHPIDPVRIYLVGVAIFTAIAAIVLALSGRRARRVPR